MISLPAVVNLVMQLLIIGLVFGLLIFVVRYAAKKFPAFQPFANIVEVILVILAVFALIGVLLGLAGYPVFTH